MADQEQTLSRAIFSFSHPDLSSPASSRPIYVPPPALSQHNLTLPLHDIRSNSELQQGLKSVDEHGFTLVKHTSAFEKDGKMQGLLKGRMVEEVYAPEMIRLALEVTGAKRAVVHNVAFRRRGFDEGEEEEQEKRGGTESEVNVNGRTQADIQQPARHAHIDLTLQGLRDTFRLARPDITAAAKSVIDAEEARERGEDVVVPRVAAYSLWRPLKSVHRDPIALLDAQTLLPTDIVATTNRIPSSYSKSSLPDNPNLLDDGTYIVSAYTALPPRHPELQRWYWVPEQRVDEVLMVKFADSWGGEAGEDVGGLSNRLSTSNYQKSPLLPYPMAPRNRTLPALPDRTKQPQVPARSAAVPEPQPNNGDQGALSTSDLIAEYCYHAMKSDEFRLALVARDVDVAKLDVDELLERKGDIEITIDIVHVMLEERGRRVVRQNKTELKLTQKNRVSGESQSGTGTGSDHSNTDNSIAAQLAARAAHQASLNSKRKRSPERTPNRHGPVISVTNPRFLPGTNEPNPFFEQMPRPEVWHRQAPRAGFLGFGDTPFSQQMMSDQIDADLARGPGRRLGGGRDQDRKVERRSGRAGMWDVPDVSDCEVFDIMKSLGGRIEEADSDSDGSEDEPMQSKKRKVEE
ncbi:unnamed protein product [Zymoseptoria tritici ST99CH_3D1]|nr:unnamed protein product [Zymoseptoria tritici ST99CH_3D1]